jgi:hypothetical protein
LSVYCSISWSMRAWYDAICASIGDEPGAAVSPNVGSSPWIWRASSVRRSVSCRALTFSCSSCPMAWSSRW